MEQNGTVQPGGGVPHTPPVTTKPRRIYQLDGKERILLPLAWALGVLCVQVLLFSRPGLGMSVLMGAWYALLLWYGGVQPLARRENRLLLGAVALLALSFALFDNQWLRSWNWLALAGLTAVQCFGAWGKGRQPWSAAAMLWERFVQTMDGLFGRLGAFFQAAASVRGISHKKTACVLGGLLVCIPVLFFVFPLLTQADSLFRQVAGEAVSWVIGRFSIWIFRLVAGLIAAPFLFGLLYALRRPEEEKGEEKAKGAQAGRLEPAGLVTVLLVMDLVYAFFLAVQAAALFGGADYLARAGISYAEYARSGFFQLAAVAAVNLTLVLLCLRLCRQQGAGWQAARVLSTALVAMSGAILLSAVWRMSLYVGEYGLSFRRALTYWGMGMLAICFVAALLLIWRAKFPFFKVVFTVCVAGWLVLNFANVDALVTRYNIARGMSPETVVTAAMENGSLRLGAMPALAQYAREHPDQAWLAQLVEEGRQQAARETESWANWSVTAQIAALQ